MPHRLFEMAFEIGRHPIVVEEGVVDGLIGDFHPDVVVHTAASYKNPDDWQADALTNCVGSANIARACSTLVFASENWRVW